MEREIAEKLLDIGAVTLSPDAPFTWSSGIISPIYCDLRITLGYPDLRSKIADSMVQIIKQYFPDTELIAGTATSGIPLAALVSDRLRLPMVYVRSQQKSYGKGKRIEGTFAKGEKAVVIEDLISTGGSSLAVCSVLEKAFLHVQGVIAVFTYELEEGKKNFTVSGYPLYSLSRLPVLLQVAAEKGWITEEELALIEDFRQHPRGWKVK